jgi:hypothetical protein
MRDIPIEEAYGEILTTYTDYPYNSKIWFIYDHLQIFLHHLHRKFVGYDVQSKYIDNIIKEDSNWLPNETVRVLLKLYEQEVVDTKKEEINFNKRAIEAIRRLINGTQF